MAKDEQDEDLYGIGNMELTLIRDRFTEKSTMGVLQAEHLTLQTLELPKKDYLPGSCIPPGRYRVTVTWSGNFQRRMPLLVGIPKRSEIEIHWGDFVENTRGCVLIGQTRTDDAIWRTRDAFNELFPLIDEADKTEGCWITVSEKE